MSNLIQISVSYNSKEILIEVNSYDDDVYNTFIRLLSEKTGEENILINYKLVPINTNIPYLLIDENNFWNIVHEDRKEEKLKLFMNKLENNVDDENDEQLLGGIKASNDNDFDDFNEEDFDLKENNNEQGLNQEKKEEEDNNNKINLNKGNDISNNNSKKEKEKKDDLLLKDDIEVDNNKENTNININEECNKKEKIEINEGKNILEDVEDIDDIVLKEKKQDNLLKNIFIKEYCSNCKDNLVNVKYICIICENNKLCNQCGEKHEHPCLIYKTPFISSLKETYTFITKNYTFPTNVFSKKIQRSMSILLMGDNNICLRPNKGALIPIKIFNNSNVIISSYEFIILVKGNKLINISYDNTSNFKILPNKFYIIKLKCITPNKICNEKINIEIYSNKYDLKQNDNLKIDINIEINEDKDEEQLNYKLFFNEMVILYNKEHKQIMVSLLENELKEYKYNSDNIIDILLKYKWNKEKVLKFISSIQNQNQIENKK